MSKEQVGKSLKIILDMLKDTNEDSRIFKADIGRKLEENDIKCHRNTVESRLNTLRDMGFDIVEIPRKGVYLEQEESNLTDGQLRILIDSIISANLLNKKNLKITVESLAELGSKEFKKHMKKYAFLTSNIAPNADQSIAKNVEDIQQAILEKKQISCNYTVYDQTFQPQKKYADAIILNPYEMAFSDGKYYLVCSFDNSEDITVLRVDRLTDVKVIDSKCPENHEITRLKRNNELYKYIYNQPRLKGGKLENFTLLCYRDSLDEVYDAFDNNESMRTVKILEENYDDPDTIGISLKTTREAMKAWAIIHAENAVVIHPEDVKEEIIEVLEKSKYTYNKSGQMDAIRSYNAMSFDDALYELRNRGYEYVHYYRPCKDKINLGKYPQLCETKTLVLSKNDISSTVFDSPLMNLTSLRLNKVTFNPEMFQMLPSLKDITISNSEIDNISFIKYCKNIRNIRILNCPNLTDLSSLLELNNLRILETFNSNLDHETQAKLKEKFPDYILILKGKTVYK